MEKKMTLEELEKEFLRKRKLPKALVNAIVEARKANKIFQAELRKYYEKCEKEKLTPVVWWIDILEVIAKGVDMDLALDELQIPPKSRFFLATLESLKAHGFPDEFLDTLITEIDSKYLDDEAKQFLREEIPLE